MDKRVFIKNISNHTIIVSEPSARLRVQLRPMGHFPIKSEDLDILANNEGFIRMVREKKLQIEDTQAGMDVGLIAPDEVHEVDGKPVQDHTEDYIEIRRLLERGTDLQVKELLQASSKSRKEMIAQIAMDCRDISYNKIRLVSSASGIDIRKAMELKEDTDTAKE